MGICSSCLGRRDDSDEGQRQRLLADDPYAQTHHNYNTWHQPPPSQPNALNPDEQKREQQAMHDIMRWASDQIVEIFPANARQHQQQTINLNNSVVNLPQSDASGANGLMGSHHQDILLSMIPGDKSKRSIRIYPASRPSTGDARSIRSKASHTKLNGSTRGTKGREGVFVRLDVDLP